MSKAVSDAPTILVFDSGLGGLTVFREVAALRPDAQYIYAADDAAFPYNNWTEDALPQRVASVMDDLIGRFEPNLIVVACNTASTIALAELRRRFSLPFVGTVPAIKPACAGSRSKLVSVLGTEATVAREYTKALIREFAQGCGVTLVGSRNLAVIAEAALHGAAADPKAIAAEIAPCFVENGNARTDTVVLACTHYPLLLDDLKRVAPWPVTFIDPAAAIARRVTDLLGPASDARTARAAGIHFTSGKAPPPPLLSALSGFGFAPQSA
jgi:glutamate racemase